MPSRFIRHWRPWGMALALALVPLALAGCGGGEEEAAPPDANAAEETPATPPAAGTPQYTRVEINSFTPDQIDALRKGVALMQQRESTDPTSWIYQANIHGVPESGDNCPASTDPMQPAWATCQHGNFFFLAWHRMYVYYFERILRAAIQEATGDPNYQFALPYWNYEDPSNEDLPEPFRVPADASNPLYVAQRSRPCNQPGQCVSPEEASDEQAMALIPFCNCPPGETCSGCTSGLNPDEVFGGQFTPQPVHFMGDFGELESQPHNVIHNVVGGPFGWMSDPDCAARDAIFWLHHANIDRLWQVWLNQGGNRANPLQSEPWTTQTFTFFDENKQQVTMTACEILNMATQLDYQYDGVPIENVVLCDQQAATATTAETAPPAAAPAPTVLATSPQRQLTLGNEPLTVSVPAQGQARERIGALAEGGEPGRVRLVVEGLSLLHRGAVYQVYLNLPQGQQPDPKSPYHVGHIALFGHAGHDLQSTRTFDITDEVRELKAKGEWTGDVKLTFVQSRGTQAAVAGAEARRPDAFIRFSRVSVITRER